MLVFVLGFLLRRFALGRRLLLVVVLVDVAGLTEEAFDVHEDRPVGGRARRLEDADDVEGLVLVLFHAADVVLGAESLADLHARLPRPAVAPKTASK